jgi:hypothetical protein
MTPTIVYRDGKPWMIVGTPGAAHHHRCVAHDPERGRLTAWTSRKRSIAPRIHQQWLPGEKLCRGPALSPIPRALLSPWATSSSDPQAGRMHVAAHPLRRAGARCKPVSGMILFLAPSTLAEIPAVALRLLRAPPI